MAELTEPGFHELELGDVVHDDDGQYKGSVVSVGGDLVILWDDQWWSSADLWEAGSRDGNRPYRIERREWDLDWPKLDIKYFDADDNEVPSFEGTDLKPRVA